MGKLLFASVLLLIIITKREFFDESLRCLGVYEVCEETQSPFKDDEVETPYYQQEEPEEDEEPEVA